MDVLYKTLQALGGYLPKVIAAVGVFTLGLLVAWIISGVVVQLLLRTKMRDWIGERTGKEVRVERWFARGVFLLIFLLVIVGLLEVLRLTNGIIFLAFTLILGAAAIAVDITVGIGGRDLTARRTSGQSPWSRKRNTGWSPSGNQCEKCS